MNIVIFGTGYIYRKYRFLLKKLDITIVGIIDNDINKAGTIVDGVKVELPNNIHNYKYDYVFIMNTYVEEVTIQLKELGVKEECIINTSKLLKNVDFSYKKHFEKTNGKKILLFSHMINLSGAAVALFRMALILKKEGYNVTVVTEVTEDIAGLLNLYVKEKISLEIYGDFKQLDISKCGEMYDLIIVNTFDLYWMSQSLSKIEIPVIWWLHESNPFYQKYVDLKNHPFCFGENFAIYTVGDQAKYGFEENVGTEITGCLLYGVPYYDICQKQRNDNKIRLAVIGNVCEAKGQNLLIEVNKANYEDWKQKIEILIVGAISEDDKKKFEKFENVRCIGVVSQEKMAGIYGQIDVLVCTSLFDTMPIVVTEAMMSKKLCVVTDVIGQAQYIQPYKNGLVCKAGDKEDLSQKIQWVLEHEEKINEIGKTSYEIYINNFSMKIFRKNVIEIIQKHIK